MATRGQKIYCNLYILRNFRMSSPKYPKYFLSKIVYFTSIYSSKNKKSVKICCFWNIVKKQICPNNTQKWFSRYFKFNKFSHLFYSFYWKYKSSRLFWAKNISGTPGSSSYNFRAKIDQFVTNFLPLVVIFGNFWTICSWIVDTMGGFKNAINYFWAWPVCGKIQAKWDLLHRIWSKLLTLV